MVAIAAVVAPLAGCARAGAGEAQVTELREQGDPMAAARAALEWADREPGNVEALRAAGELGLRVGLKGRAEEAARALLSLKPADARAHVLLGEALLGRSAYADAEAEFQAAIAAEPDCAEAYVGLARVTQLNPHQADEALSAAEVAVQVAPHCAPAHAAMGAALRGAGDLDGALAASERALQVDPECAPALFEMGLTFAAAGRTEAAHEAWRRYLALEPHSDQAWLLKHNLVVTGVDPLVDYAEKACYSPDGTVVAFYQRQAPSIYLIGPDSGWQPRRLCVLDGPATELAWSPDSSAVLVCVSVPRAERIEGQEPEVTRLVRVPVDGGAAQTLGEYERLYFVAPMPGTDCLIVCGPLPEAYGGPMSPARLDPLTGAVTPIPELEGIALPAFTTPNEDGSLWAAFSPSRARDDGVLVYDLWVSDDLGFEAPRALMASTRPERPAFTPDGVGVVVIWAEVRRSCELWVAPADGAHDPIPFDRCIWPCTPSFGEGGRAMLSQRRETLVRLTLDGLRDE